MRFKDLIETNPFSLVVSLPANDLDLAKAALDGGAQAVKVHCNVWHRASGHTFGTYDDNRKFLKDLIKLCGDIPVGLVPGGEDAFITPDERLELEDAGLAFFSAYSHHLPCHMMESTKLTKMVAIDSTYTANTLDAVRQSAIDVLECSVQPGENYGTNLNYADILRYSDIVEKTDKPCLIPTQRHIRPGEISHLKRAGCKAIMIGAIVMGKEPTAADVEAVTRQYRNAVDAL